MYLIRNRSEDHVRISHKPPAGKPYWTAEVHLNRPIAGTQRLILVDEVRHKPYDHLISPPGGPAPHTAEYNIHYLKSNLQKTFRRREEIPCLATVVQLLHQDPQEALRRIAVVLLEDAALCPYVYNHIIWLMYANSKGYKLRESDRQAVVDAVATGLEMTFRYNLDLPASTAILPTPDFWNAPEEAQEAAIGPALRAAAGGMAFDTRFLTVLAERALKARNAGWEDFQSDRLAERALIGQLGIEDMALAVNYSSIPEFTVDSCMVIQAIDFHCYPRLLDDLPYKDAIWWHWSSLNVRPIVDDGSETANAKEAAERARWYDTFRSIEGSLRYAAGGVLGRMQSEKTRPAVVTTLDMWLLGGKMAACGF